MKHPNGVLWLAMTLGLASAASMALEIVAGRALAPYVGMSLYTWTVIIAVVLAGLSLGHWIGGRVADRTARPARAVAWSLTAAAATTIGSLAMLRAAAPLGSGLDPIQHITWLAMAAFFLPSAIAGLLSPLLTVIALASVEEARRGRALGTMFAAGALGAIAGTVGSGLILISWLGTGYSVALIGGIYAVLSLGYWRRWTAAVAATLFAVAGALVLGSPGSLGLRNDCLVESQYFCIRVDDLQAYGRPSRVMALDHLGHGVNDRDDPRLLPSSYVQAVDELVAHRLPGPELTAFFVGGGAYTLPRAWQARYPEGRFIVAEIDPQVTRIAKSHLWYAPDDRTDIRHGDARQVLNSLPPDRRFDVIFGDAFHDISIPQHLVTDEFHAGVKARLTPSGVYVLNVVDALRHPLFMLSLATTLKDRFAHVELWLDIGDIQPDEARTTWIVLASDRATGAGEIEAAYGFGRHWVQVPLDRMIQTVGAENLVFLTDDYAPVDRLLSGVLLNAELSETMQN